MNLAKETQEFCKHWLQKAKNYDSHAPNSELQDAFDKFFTLFVAFNRLYLYTAVVAQQPKAREWRKVQRIFPEIVGHDRLWRAVNRPQNGDVDTLRRLIGPNGSFWLISGDDPNRPDQAANDDLHRRLGNQSSCVALEALLQYLYKVRCNMFHGTKGFHHEQLQILEPCNRCLERILSEGMRWLRNETQQLVVRRQGVSS